MPSLLGREHDRRAVRVVGADEVHLVALHPLEAHPDVGLDVLHDVADVERAVGVGQRRGDEELAGHGMGMRLMRRGESRDSSKRTVAPTRCRGHRLRSADRSLAPHRRDDPMAVTEADVLRRAREPSSIPNTGTRFRRRARRCKNVQVDGERRRRRRRARLSGARASIETLRSAGRGAPGALPGVAQRAASTSRRRSSSHAVQRGVQAAAGRQEHHRRRLAARAASARARRRSISRWRSPPRAPRSACSTPTSTARRSR